MRSKAITRCPEESWKDRVLVVVAITVSVVPEVAICKALVLLLLKHQIEMHVSRRKFKPMQMLQIAELSGAQMELWFDMRL